MFQDSSWVFFKKFDRLSQIFKESTWFVTKVTQWIRKNSFFINVVGPQHIQKWNIWILILCLIPHANISSRCIADLNWQEIWISSLQKRISEESVNVSKGAFYYILFKISVQIQLSPFSHIILPCPPPAPLVFVHGSFIHVPWPDLPLSVPVTPLPPPLWSLSVCSLFPCLWLYFAQLFVLLIRLHL